MYVCCSVRGGHSSEEQWTPDVGVVEGCLVFVFVFEELIDHEGGVVTGSHGHCDLLGDWAYVASGPHALDIGLASLVGEDIAVFVDLDANRNCKVRARFGDEGNEEHFCSEDSAVGESNPLKLAGDWG